MKIKVYCDTCVYRDYYEWREGHTWLHYGEEAKKLLDNIENGAFILIVSDHLAFQLKKFPQYTLYVAKLRAKNLIEVKTTAIDKQNANQESTEYEDAIHAHLAIKAGAQYLATDNVEHFAVFKDRIKIRRPENVY